MGRLKRNTKALNCNLDVDVWNRLNGFSGDTGINKTFIVEKALMEYMDKYDEQKRLIEKHNSK